uniref:Putative adherens-junction anchoring domain-containing protein n=1 Tax=Zonotrichia albicollis TaxID=44394 RepID=A0A8D2N3Z1_ZONAL
MRGGAGRGEWLLWRVRWEGAMGMGFWGEEYQHRLEMSWSWEETELGAQGQRVGAVLGCHCCFFPDGIGAFFADPLISKSASLPAYRRNGLHRPPSAELFHYDSTNAVNWGMRGEGTSWGHPEGLPMLRGCQPPQAALQGDGVPPGSPGAGWCQQSWGSRLSVCLSVCSPHRVQGKSLLLKGEATSQSPRDVSVCPQALQREAEPSAFVLLHPGPGSPIPAPWGSHQSPFPPQGLLSTIVPWVRSRAGGCAAHTPAWVIPAVVPEPPRSSRVDRSHPESSSHLSLSHPGHGGSCATQTLLNAGGRRPCPRSHGCPQCPCPCPCADLPL